jgi:DNA invertase Pin-like site-specific DNA recombinase
VIVVAVAQIERDIITECVTAGLRRARKNGKSITADMTSLARTESWLRRVLEARPD